MRGIGVDLLVAAVTGALVLVLLLIVVVSLPVSAVEWLLGRTP